MGVNLRQGCASHAVAAFGIFTALSLASPAAASPSGATGSTGATSSASVRISATVAPRFRAQSSGVATVSLSAALPDQQNAHEICFDSNMNDAQFSISAAPAGTPVVPASAPLAFGNRGHARACVLIGEAASPSAGHDAAPGSVTLLIAGE